jgi:anti-sigma B factor antagonist
MSLTTSERQLRSGPVRTAGQPADHLDSTREGVPDLILREEWRNAMAIDFDRAGEGDVPDQPTVPEPVGTSGMEVDLARSSPLAVELRGLVDAAAAGRIPVETVAERRLLSRIAAALSAFDTVWSLSGSGGGDEDEKAPVPAETASEERTPEVEFGMEVSEVDGEVVISVRGELDLQTCPLLWNRLAEAIPLTRQRLVVDLRNATFIDSTGLAVFVRAFKRLRHGGADLVLRSPNKSARKVLHITGLDRVMTIET